ncbi:TKL protein kinase [Phytophthora palmivora]|uniref:TKL protein kinase n=1 Tax=Phytophthora palmivora TaxID=4796 RepID=A0A2P4YTC7_9STRA|nr:TKL protein kinase [Phytophthora palmivora]
MSTVTVKEINADPGCSGRTTAIYSTITEDTCSGGVTCTTESGWTDTTSSEYKLCNYDRAGYLRYAFPNVQYLLFDYYEDNECKTLVQSNAILADGECHSSVHYTLMFETGDDGTVYVLSRGIDCNRGEWSNFTEPIPKDMINSGKCFVGEHTIGKVYLCFPG